MFPGPCMAGLEDQKTGAGATFPFFAGYIRSEVRKSEIDGHRTIDDPSELDSPSQYPYQYLGISIWATFQTKANERPLVQLRMFHDQVS